MGRGDQAAVLNCISLWQPHASLLFAPHPDRPDEVVKPDETRDWDAPRRVIGKRIAIHAAKRFPLYDDLDPLHILCVRLFGEDYRKTLPRGAFLGTAVLASSRRMNPLLPLCGAGDPLNELCGYWVDGRYAHRYVDHERFPAAVPARGQQGWWRCDPTRPDAPRPAPEPAPPKAAPTDPQMELFG